MRTTFGVLPIGAQFKVVNLVSGQVLPLVSGQVFPQESATKTEPGVHLGKHRFNYSQPYGPSWKRRIGYWFAEDSMEVEVEEVTHE